MATCFENIIGLKGTCENPVSTSGLFINDIGISIDELNALVTNDYASGEDLFNSKIEFARKIIVQNIHNHLAEKYKANSVLKSSRLGFFQDNLSLILGEAGINKGIEIEFCNDNSFVDLFVSEISLQINFSGAVSILVYDLIQNKLLDTLAITTVANEITTTYPMKTYKSNRKHLDLIFVYLSTGKDSNKTYLKQGGCTNCGSGNNYSNSYLTARAVKIATAVTKIKSNLDFTNDTGGMSIMYSLNCNHEDWLCTLANTIALPILYKTAAEIMEFGIHNSNRINSNTIIDYDKMKERFEYYESKFVESFESILKNIQIPNDEKCFYCNSKSRHVIAIP